MSSLGPSTRDGHRWAARRPERDAVLRHLETAVHATRDLRVGFDDLDERPIVQIWTMRFQGVDVAQNVLVLLPEHSRHVDAVGEELADYDRRRGTTIGAEVESGRLSLSGRAVPALRTAPRR